MQKKIKPLILACVGSTILSLTLALSSAPVWAKKPRATPPMPISPLLPVHPTFQPILYQNNTIPMTNQNFTPNAFTPLIAPTIPFEKVILPNGLTLIMHQDKKAPIVAVNLWYHVGSKDEKPGKTGFAHLFEHLMFSGSEHFDDEYFRPFENVGATDMNGTTAEDRTNYFANVPKSALDMALFMESDRMGHLLGAINQAKLDEQRDVVKNEKRQRENSPYGKAWDLITKNTYPAGHPYSWTVIGEMEDLDRASLNDVHEWFKTHYGAANATLVIAGDIDFAETRAKVEKYFGGIAGGPPLARQNSWIAKMTGTHRMMMEDRVPQARIYKVWNVPDRTDPELNDLDLLSDLLSGGKNSRLYKRLVYQDQIASDVSAYVDDRELGSQFGIIATAKPGIELARIEAVIDEELKKLLFENINQDELDRVRTGKLAGFIRGVERIGGFGGKSDVLAAGQVYENNPASYENYFKNVESATPARLQKVGQKWLTDGQFILEVLPYVERTANANPEPREKGKLPDTGTPPDLVLPAMQRATLSNGLKIILAERNTVPVVEFKLLFDAGFASDSVGNIQPGRASMAMAMLDEGTSSRNALQISAELETLGAYLSSTSGLDTCQVSLSALKARLAPSLDILADVLQNPNFPEFELNRLRDQALVNIAQERAKPQSLAYRVLPPLLYGKDHPYGQPLSGRGNEASLKSLTRENLIEFRNQWIRPDNATLVVAGDIDLATLIPLLETRLKDWQNPSTARPQKTFVSKNIENKDRVFLLDRKGAEQSVIIGGRLAPPKGDTQDIAWETMNEILGGMFTSRINMNLREAKHWTYGARSALVSAKGQRPYLFIAPVQADKTAESIQEIRLEIAGILGKKAISAEELSSAQNNQTLKLPGEHETIDSVIDTLTANVVYGLPDNYWQNYVSSVRALTPTDVVNSAQNILAETGYTWVIVGDLAKIGDAVRSLNLGEVEVLSSSEF